MFKKYLLGLGALSLAFAVLAVSVFRSASIVYPIATPAPSSASVLGKTTTRIDYQLPFAGRILPDNPLWVLKALRDKVWFAMSTNPLKKAELALLFSDKRLESSKSLFTGRKPDIALSTLAKGEKYLEIAAGEETVARKEGMDTGSFLIKLATSSLKHRQIIETELMPLAPEDAKPLLVKIEDYSKNVYKSSRDALNDKGIPAPNDPFAGD